MHGDALSFLRRNTYYSGNKLTFFSNKVSGCRAKTLCREIAPAFSTARFPGRGRRSSAFPVGEYLRGILSGIRCIGGCGISVHVLVRPFEHANLRT